MHSMLCLLAASIAFSTARHMRLPEKTKFDGASQALSFHNSHRAELAGAPGPHPYGDARCPCVGFDNMQGAVTFQIDETTKAQYPAEVGGTCQAWDYQRYPKECEQGTDADYARLGEMPEWCLKQWCYVDACNCHIHDNPKISKYMPSATFQGKQLYYSYATCGEEDTWTASHHKGHASYFEVVSGRCELSNYDTCVSSPNYPNNYPNGEQCEIKTDPGTLIQTRSFETEHGYDFMHIDGVPYHGGTGPNAVTLNSGKITWKADSSGSRKGWQICMSHHNPQPGACVNQHDEGSCNRMDKCAWDSAETRCMGKEVHGECEMKDPMQGSHDPPCECIGINGLYGATDVNVNDAGEPEKLAKYPMSVGSACWAWDWAHHPDCTGPSPPSWCSKKWCYVSPCGCKLESSPKRSHYFPDVVWQGRPLYYSYATCGEKDTWTAKEFTKACPNQKTEFACKEVPECGWTGKECLGKELVEECHGLPSIEPKEPKPKSNAWNSAPCAILMTFLAFNA